MKPEFGMQHWWIEEMKDGSNRLRGNITDRGRFINHDPVLHFEPTFTSTIIHINEFNVERIETINSIYIIGEPIPDEILEAHEADAFALLQMYDCTKEETKT